MVKITCITKDNGNHYNTHEAIEKLGWIVESTAEKGISTLQEMVEYLEKGNRAYVSDAFGNKVYLYVRVSERTGRKFVQTIADDRYTNNLLELKECN